MKVYGLTGGFFNGEFKFEMEEGNVIEYEENKKLICQYGLITSHWHAPKLDEFFTGLLDSDNPKVSIKTLDINNINRYKKAIKDIISQSLNKKKNKIFEQLEILKSFE
jgi:hypothetical protein